LKPTILGLILCVVTIIAVAVPLYPVSGTQISADQAQPKVVYTLPLPVILAGYCGVACWVSESFSLQPGTIQVAVAECRYCEVWVDNDNASYNAAVIGPVSPIWQGVPSPLTETGKVVDAGSYHVVLGNEGNVSGTVSSLVVANTPTSTVPEFSFPTLILITSIFMFVVASTTKRPRTPHYSD
jgi:hypothetical protein